MADTRKNILSQQFDDVLSNVGNKVYSGWKKSVPIDARFFLQTLLGNRNKPFTASDVTPEELQQINQVIKESKPNNLYRAKDDILKGKMTEILVNASKNDPDWARYSFLKNKRNEWEKTNSSNMFDPPPFKYNEEYSKLYTKLTDRYEKIAQNADPNFKYSVLNSSYAVGQSLGKQPKEIENNYLNDSNTNAEKIINSGQNRLKKISEGGGDVQYEDYPNNAGLIAQGVIPNKPNKIATALGRFNYETDKSGNTVVKDNYDFWNEGRKPAVESYEKMNPLVKAAVVPVRAIADILSMGGQGFNPIWGVQEVGNAYIGRNGRPVNITYDSKNYEKNK